MKKQTQKANLSVGNGKILSEPGTYRLVLINHEETVSTRDGLDQDMFYFGVLGGEAADGESQAGKQFKIWISEPTGEPEDNSFKMPTLNLIRIGTALGIYSEEQYNKDLDENGEWFIDFSDQIGKELVLELRVTESGGKFYPKIWGAFDPESEEALAIESEGGEFDDEGKYLAEGEEADMADVPY